MFRLLCLAMGMLVLTACSPEPGAPAPVAGSDSARAETALAVYDPARDYFTFSNYEQFVTRHIALDLNVDFEVEELQGSVRLFMRQLEPAARSITLDTRDIHIAQVQVSSLDGPALDAGFALGEMHETLGQPLVITLPEKFKTEDEFELIIKYRTDPASTALQWLPASLTAGGDYPLLFSQSQSIHARSWIPLQDTPAIRITYEARIQTPQNLLALMSANNDPLAERNGEYYFDMPQPIPSYLMAIAVGNLFFAELGEQTGLYAEPAILEAARWEFAETQQMMDLTEQTYGAYAWGRYDLLVLPPSFPYGGMENPRLSFITPSLLAGDRSLVAVIAHELAHSWSGNLVTNRTWRDIWLNEGFTSYLDARLIEMLYGKERADEERYLSYTGLLQDFNEVIPPMQALAPEKRGSEDEESQGSTYYAKGQFLLEHLEGIFGRETFDEFLAGYFQHFAWQSITTGQFVAYLDQNLLQKDPGKYSVDQLGEWLYQPGLPAEMSIPRSATLEKAAAAGRAFAAGEIAAGDIPLGEFSPHAIINLVNSLPAQMSREQLVELDGALNLSNTGNAMIARAWFTQVAQRRHTPAYVQMEQHLKRNGRMLLITDIYRALLLNGQDAELARNIFGQAKASYHPIAVRAVEQGFQKAGVSLEGI